MSSRLLPWYRQHVASRRSARPHGYLAALGLRATDSTRLVAQIGAGLPVSALQAFRRNSGLPQEAIIELVGLTPRTFARRRVQKRLRPDESDRLVRAARLYVGVVELFEGDEPQARRWLTSAQPALGGAVPTRFAATDVGAREVEELVGRLEHGIPS